MRRPPLDLRKEVGAPISVLELTTNEVDESSMSHWPSLAGSVLAGSEMTAVSLEIAASGVGPPYSLSPRRVVGCVYSGDAMSFPGLFFKKKV